MGQLHVLLTTFGKIYNFTSKGIECNSFIKSCAFVLVLVVGSAVIFHKYRVRLREMRQEFPHSENLQIELIDDHLEEIEEKESQLETFYEGLIRKHKTTAISLNQQIQEVQAEVAQWKASKANKNSVE
uniref:Uncharacterized protein n=1 Tax=Glossina brevipalpis TaxID=37001 RepID=A0A1A9W6S1_9MUSC